MGSSDFKLATSFTPKKDREESKSSSAAVGYSFPTFLGEKNLAALKLFIMDARSTSNFVLKYS